MGSECGPGGGQSRAVWCSHVEGWTTLHTNCDASERPSGQQSCFRVCDWHKDLYDWQLGAWNRCAPVGGRQPAICTRGDEGIQTREVACVQKADGEAAEDAICEYFEPKPRLEQACLIPCPRDCVVSQFGAWTPCSKTCGMGLQNRIRTVLAPPLFGGSACPNLTEFQTCQLGTCESNETLYSLRVGPWGPCTVPLPRQARQAHQARPPSEAHRNTRAEKKTKKDDKLDKGGDREGDRGSVQGDKPPRANRKSARPDRQVGGARRRKKLKNKEKKEKTTDRLKDKVRDPETKESMKKKRTRNRQNRPGGKFWDIQVGFQTREVTCVHRSGNVEALR